MVKGEFKSVYEPEVQRLVRILSEVKANVEIFRALLSRTVKVPRQPREKAWISYVIGYTMKYLFGTRDNRDMETINHLVNSTSTFTEKVGHTTEQEVTYIKQFDSRVHDNMKNVATMATMLRKEMVDNLSRIVVRGLRWLVFSAAMRDLEIALIQTKEDLL